MGISATTHEDKHPRMTIKQGEFKQGEFNIKYRHQT
jgi:hypothetical protein